MKNRRSIISMAVLALYCACSGGADKGTGPGGGAVAAIGVASASGSAVTIGLTLPLVATATSTSGSVVTGQTFVWNSSDTLVASVSSSGVVTGVSAGVASISATIGTVVGQTAISVTASAVQLTCSSGNSLALNVGDVHQLTGLERSSLCVTGAAASEYVLIAFNHGLDTTATAKPLALTATNTVLTQNAPSPLRIPAGAHVVAPGAARDVGFEAQLRAMERRDLNPRFAAAREWQAARFAPAVRPRGFSAITGVPSSPAVGSLISLNGNGTSSCGTPQPHGARIVAVSSHAIVAVDTLAPPDGFANADYLSFAATFDTLIYPLDTLNFGSPTDIDGNGHVLLFFSQAVNQLSAAGSNTYVGGFFFARDLFPLASTSTLAACAGSNVGEMFYLPVLDTAQIYNGFFKNRKTVTSQLLTTIAHEFQHLINAGRHLYVNTAATRLEESWLDESQAMLAQELLYFHVSGFGPRQNLTYAQITTGSNENGLQSDFVGAYLIEGLSSLNVYLQIPESTTPYNNTENVATLGAGWEFMRYLLDASPGASAAYSRAIDNGVVSGFANVSNAFSLTLPALANSYESWSIAQYIDGTGLTTSPAYSFPSWNFRDVIARAVTGGVFPLRIRPLLATVPVSIALRGGAASYIRFRVNAGQTGQILPAAGTNVSTQVSLALVRTF